LSAELPITKLFNDYLGVGAGHLLDSLGIHAHNPARPFTNWVAVQIFTVLLLIGLFVIVRTRLSVDNPGVLQHITESFHNFIDNLGRELIGHHHERFTPFLLSLGLFILSMNLIGLIPGFESPTANPSVPLGCALASFVYYHMHGVRKQGIVHYLLHFAGPQDKSIPLAIRLLIGVILFPIEIVSHLARVLSLTVRLFANIFAGDMLTLAFFSLVPLGVPIIFLGLHLGVSLIQTYIFVLLSTVYLSGAVAEEH
jgi:F-type H+-transporting ATPase subunit a